MSDGRREYARMRSLLEVPILTEKYWSKVPTVAADGILIDLEDSAAPNTKELVRERIVEALAEPEYFGDRTIIVRVNNLATLWGRDDLAALADAPGDFLVCYPKIETADELTEARGLLERSGNRHGLHVMIETARAMIELDRIASADAVAGLHFGYVDYAADVGSRPFAESGDDLWAPANHYARTKIAVAAAAYGLFCTGGTLIPEYRDLAKVRAFVRGWRDLGYTALIAISPAHLDIVNEAMSPSPDEIEHAREVCRTYETALAQNEPAAVLDGKVITNPDYRVAGLVLARAGVS
ncbi:HpcH/HpaI aldolase/citrate lyase family protein [Saccharopolyspora sp. NPDC000995]